jgi:hypothetical protein
VFDELLPSPDHGLSKFNALFGWPPIDPNAFFLVEDRDEPVINTNPTFGDFNGEGAVIFGRHVGSYLRVAASEFEARP